jgi:large subunit ribosomal protein L19
MNSNPSFSSDTIKQLEYLKPGNTIKVFYKIKEGDKSRIQVFEGRITKKHEEKTINATITVRRVTSGHGVERIFPLHSPLIEKIEIVKIANRVRKANLNYLRDRDGKKAKLKETVLHEKLEVILAQDKKEMTNDIEIEEVKTDENASPEEVVS